MQLQEEKLKLEKLFNKNGDLRSLIPLLLENKLFYERLKNCVAEWDVLKNALMSIGIIIGDALDIYNLLINTHKKDIEDDSEIVGRKTKVKNKIKEGKMVEI